MPISGLPKKEGIVGLSRPIFLLIKKELRRLSLETYTRLYTFFLRLSWKLQTTIPVFSAQSPWHK